MTANISHPIGIVQIIDDDNPERYDHTALRNALNRNGFIVRVVKIHQLTEQLEKLKQKYNLPICLFGCGAHGHIVQRITDNPRLCRAGVLVTDRPIASRLQNAASMLVGWTIKMLCGNNAPAKIFYKHPISGIVPQHPEMTCGEYWTYVCNIIRTEKTPPSAPLMIISDENNITRLSGRMTRTLYNTYNKSDLSNLTLIFYADLFSDNANTQMHDDVVKFFCSAINRQ